MHPPQAGPARFQPASDRSLLIYCGEAMTPEAGERVLKLLRLLESEPLSAVRNLHPAYASLLITFDPLKTSHAELESALRKYIDRLDVVHLPQPRLVEIPVCYGEDFGPDLADLAALHDLTIEQAIDAHAAPIYTVCFLGFVPGFAYLAGLPATLATPRLATPRRHVPAGSVGIAGQQTGIYPCATPGGWRLLGRTPLKMFRADRPEMSLLAIGDRVRFAPISRERFADVSRERSANLDRP
jgi:KipI family sensor histidine kinase inhibitor